MFEAFRNDWDQFGHYMWQEENDMGFRGVVKMYARCAKDKTLEFLAARGGVERRTHLCFRRWLRGRQYGRTVRR